MSAGMAQFGQRVIFRQNRHLVFMLFAGVGLERCIEAGEGVKDLKPLLSQQRCHLPGSFKLLGRNLRVISNVIVEFC